MSASNEWFEYHLTSNGWVEGSEKIDFSGVHEKEIPEDRVLTLRFHEYLSSGFSKMDMYYTVKWQHEDSSEIRKLKKEFGKMPEGYDDKYKKR